MKFRNIVVAVISIFLMFVNSCNASDKFVKIVFHSNGKCVVNCNEQESEFNSIEELSNSINDITKDYFTVDSIDKQRYLEDTIFFKNFNNVSNSKYTLFIQGTYTFHPYIMLDYKYNSIDNSIFDLQFITSLKLYSSLYDNINDCAPDAIKCNNPNIVLFNDKQMSNYYNNSWKNCCITF